jgi:hypothetical protein
MGAFQPRRVAIARGDDLSSIRKAAVSRSLSEDGNWFTRGALTVFEYRFRG